MTHEARSAAVVSFCAAALVITGLGLPVSAARETAVTYHAVAVNLSNVGRAGVRPLDINVERWTTDEEFARLRDALVEKGPDGLMKELQKVKPRAGFLRSSTGGLGWDIRFAQRVDLPGGGHRVVFATDRPMSFAERSARPRSADYEFLLGEIRIRANGEGEGKLVPIAKITYNEESRTIEIENYATEPVRLTKVTEGKRKGA
jgi:hypothetical protein